MGSGGWLHQGKVLAPLMFVVLYENLSTLFYFLAITCLFLFERRDLRIVIKQEKNLVIYIFIDSEGLGPLPTYP